MKSTLFVHIPGLIVFLIHHCTLFMRKVFYNCSSKCYGGPEVHISKNVGNQTVQVPIDFGQKKKEKKYNRSKWELKLFDYH